MSVRETHPLLRQLVHPWGLNLTVRVVAADVAVAQIVREDEHDVWRLRVLIGGGYGLAGAYAYGD